MREGLLGIDIGTSGCKTIIIETSGKIITSATYVYEGVQRPYPNWSEQDPELWVKGACETIKEVLAKAEDVKILAIGLSGQMHGLTPLDENFQVLRPAILWNDQRNKEEVEWITKQAGGEKTLVELINNRMLVGYTAGKIIWLKNHEPDVYKKMRYALNPKDYLRYRLTGAIATEVSDASGTGLFDVKARKWSLTLIEKIGIDAAILPPSYESQEVISEVSQKGAQQFSLPSGIPVIGGGGDSVIQTFGSGIAKPGELQTTIGTAGILASALNKPVDNTSGTIQIFCNIAQDRWHAMGVTLNAGSIMSWFRRHITGFNNAPIEFSEITRLAEESPPGANGLLFLPFLHGERSPYSDPNARGAFVGLSAQHTFSDIARSILEGVMHTFYDMNTLLKQMNIHGALIKASGGGARSELWRQMQADFFECEVVTTDGAAEGGAYAAALLAGVGIKVWNTIDEAAAVIKNLTYQQPNKKNTKIYHQQYDIYKTLYGTLKEVNMRLSEFILVENQ